MYHTPSRLPEPARRKICDALHLPLLEGIDLHTQIKVAHWNVKGPHFAHLHPLFETFAGSLAAHVDSIAERAVTLGDNVPGTARQVAVSTHLPEMPRNVVRDLELVMLVSERLEVYIESLRAARGVIEKEADPDTVDLLTGIIIQLEKDGWFLRASMEH